MYNESYEEYIRSILGYPNYGNNVLKNNYQYIGNNSRNNEQDAELEACYPEIYKIVYPMVNKACSSNMKPVTPNLIEELTNEIYSSIETDNEVKLTINLTNEVKSNENRYVPNNNVNMVKENRGEDRQFKNRGLQDLIRILLIRELLGRPERFPGNRPSFQPQRLPMRPLFPGELGGGRLPIMPRNNYYENIYE